MHIRTYYTRKNSTSTELDPGSRSRSPLKPKKMAKCWQFQLDPAKPCQAQAASEARHANLVWIRFIDSFDIGELSASTLAQLFTDYGDFQLLKDAPQSCILNFSKFDKDSCDPHPASPTGFMVLMEEKKEKM